MSPIITRLYLGLNCKVIFSDNASWFEGKLLYADEETLVFEALERKTPEKVVSVRTLNVRHVRDIQSTQLTAETVVAATANHSS